MTVPPLCRFVHTAIQREAFYRLQQAIHEEIAARAALLRAQNRYDEAKRKRDAAEAAWNTTVQ
jgi:hypothetical protein